MENPTKDNEPNLEDYSVLKEYEDVFGELQGFSPKRDLEFSIDFMSGAAPISKTPYRMRTLESKRVVDVDKRVVEEGVHMPKCFTCGCPISFCEEKRWNSKVRY
jgi:hypothetical protein